MAGKVVHCKKESYDVYIGRPSKWGNPYSHKDGTLAQFKVATREEAVLKYKEYLIHHPELLRELPKLRNKTLGCWCAPQACHGDVIAKLAVRPYWNIVWEYYLEHNYLRTDRIGEVIQYVRYGEIPTSGKSKWWHTLGEGLKSYPELKGVSVFEIKDGIEVIPHIKIYNTEFLARPKYIGTGKIVGWGTDDEPLIEVVDFHKV